MISTDVLIIGAGVAGLLLGKHLKSDSIILEKSRGVGGRVANRRIDELGFDHGAPYLPDDPIIRETLVEFGLEEDVQSDSHGIFIPNSMTRFPKKMLENLDIRKSTRVELITRVEKTWVIKCDTGESFESKTLVLTAPLPQSLELLNKSNISYPVELDSIQYLKAVMALIITQDGLLPDLSQNPLLHSILPMKLRNLHPNGFVLRASPEESDRLFDSSDELVLKELLSHFKKSYSNPPEIIYSELKKWRYVTPVTTHPNPFIEVQNNLYLIGDAFHYPDIRGSILGALLLAEKLS